MICTITFNPIWVCVLAISSWTSSMVVKITP